MKKICYKFGNALAALALFVTVFDVNSACIFLVHQPTLPAGAAALSRINK